MADDKAPRSNGEQLLLCGLLKHAIDVDDLLTMRDVLSEDEVARGVVLRSHLTDCRELCRLTAGDGAFAVTTLEDRVLLKTLSVSPEKTLR